MVRKIITGLVVLMGISIAGIIIVQLIWVKNAIRLRNEQFERGVSDAMHQTVNRLEKIHDVMVIRHLAHPDSLPFFGRQPGPLSPDAIHRIPRPVMDKRHPARIIRERNQEKVEIEIKTDSVKFVQAKRPTVSGAVWVGKEDPARVSQVIVLNGDTLSKSGITFSRGMQTLDSISILLDTVTTGENAWSGRVRVRAQNLRNLAEKAVTEIKVLDNPLIDRQELEEILQDELINRNIRLPYQFGIIRDTAMLMSSPEPDSLALMNTTYRIELYPNSIFRRNIQLTLWFPARDRYIFTSMGWLLGASLLFSLVILLAFSFSIFFLLRQKKISEMKADFINNMTHEFKTPIATISVASDSILDQKVIGDQSKVAYFASMIKKENQRMNRQVEDILTIARLEKKELGFKWELVNIHEVIAEVADVIRVQVEQRQGTLNELLSATNPLIRSDLQHISHVIFNLLDNALKYSPGNPEITIETGNTREECLIRVTDKGIGMNRQVQSRIFERFYRQQGGNVHNVKGFGLGLSYVKAIVEAHNGRITVESEVGKGSTFTVFLPYD